jgi:hypothetical protein
MTWQEVVKVLNTADQSNFKELLLGRSLQLVDAGWIFIQEEKIGSNSNDQSK